MTVQTNTLHLGVLGKNLGHSLSPEIHTDLLNQLQIQGTYEKYEMNELEVTQVLDFMKERQITGMNVTIPYKEELYKMVDVPDSHAKEIGAVNTILIQNGISYGYNTDYIGATTMLKKSGIDLQHQRIVILGAGGACKALVYGLHLEGAASITVAARSEKAKTHLKECFPYIRTCSFQDIPEGDLIINTTPVGMFPNIDASPADAEILKKFRIAADIVYNPLLTKFLQIAKEEGLQVVTGLNMLVNQAIASEEIWLNKKINYEIGYEIHEKLKKMFN